MESVHCCLNKYRLDGWLQIHYIVKNIHNRSTPEISSLLNFPQANVSGILTKWKWLGTTASPCPNITVPRYTSLAWKNLTGLHSLLILTRQNTFGVNYSRVRPSLPTLHHKCVPQTAHSYTLLDTFPEEMSLGLWLNSMDEEWNFTQVHMYKKADEGIHLTIYNIYWCKSE